MKKLGLVGGMGPESTIPYYHDIVYGVRERTGAFPLLSIESVNVFDILHLCGERKYEALTEYLKKAIENLANGGAELAALSANTPHIVFDRLEKESPIPLVSIVEATCTEAVRRGLKRIGLIGTLFTMREDFFRRPFFERGIEIVTPTEGEMAFINEKIVTELEAGVVKEQTQKAFCSILRRMQSEAEIQAVILGCTELPLLLNDDVSPVPCLDTMQIHVRTLIERIVE